MAGNLMGSRAWGLYQGDDGTDYAYLTDADLKNATNAGNPPEGTPRLPKGLFPRYVNCVDANGNKKRLVSPNPESTSYLNGGTVAIDGVNFTITGRVGEKATFPRYGAA